MKTEKVDVSAIRHGDTIVINGVMKTISGNQIKNNPMFGVSIDGNYFRDSDKKVERVLFPKWYKGEIVRYQAQI